MCGPQAPVSPYALNREPAGLFLSAYSKLDGNNTVLYIFVILFFKVILPSINQRWLYSVEQKEFCIVVTDRDIILI